MQTTEECVNHTLKFKDCSNGETLWECSVCDYYEIAYQDCLGG